MSENSLMIPDGLIFPDDVHEALLSRRDMYRVLVRENPLLRAADLLHQISILVDQYQAVVRDEIWNVGFHQFPQIDFVAGRDIAENGHGCPSGLYDMNMERVREVCLQDPKPLHNYLLKMRLEDKRRAERTTKNKHKKVKIKASIIDRLGYVPKEWKCFHCSGVGTEDLGPDNRAWHADHCYPKVLGGDNRADNMVLSCATCNMKKGARSGREFLIATETHA